MISIQPWRMIKSIFGHGDNGDKRDVIVPTGIRDLLGTLHASGKNPLSTWYSDRMHLTQDRMQAYREFDDMDADDICFAGDTMIDLENEDLPIKELVGKPPFKVFSFDISKQRVAIGTAIARKSKENAEILGVTLDNGLQIKSTPEHEFLMKSSYIYKKAKDLKKGDILASPYAANIEVASVMSLPNEDVYDLQVEKYNNFALSAGVFVHNCGSALDLYAEDATQPSQESGKRIWVEAMNEDVENICNKMLTRTNADEQCFPIAREIAKYGNSFSAIIQEQKDDGTPGEIVQLMAAPVYAMSRIEDDEGRLIGFTIAPIEQVGRNIGMTQPSDLTQGKATDPAWSFIHWRILGRERIESYGTSLLWPARRPYRRLRMAEDALTIYRVKRAPDRFVFAIKGLSGMSPEDRRRAMKKIRQELRKKHLLDKTNGNVYQQMDPVGVDEDIIIDDESVTVTRLSGSSQINNVLDVDYLRKRFYGSLKIPPDYMGFSDSKGGFMSESPLAYQDINFSRVVKRVQYSTMQGYALACQLNLCWLGIDPRADQSKFIIHMNPVSALDEKNQLELERVRAETLEILQRVGKALGIDSDDWHAYLLQRSKVPTHLLRKNGKETSTIIKGKVTVTESTQKDITEKLDKLPDQLKESFDNVNSAIELKNYHYIVEGNETKIESGSKMLSITELFSPSFGSNICNCDVSFDHIDESNLPLRKKKVVEGKGKKPILTESEVVAEWKTDVKQKEIETLRETIVTGYKEANEAYETAVAEALKLEAAAEKYDVNTEDYDDE